MNATRFVTPIAVILLLWNLIGVAAFAMQYSADLDTLALTDPTTAHAFAMMPVWVWVAYAIAVGAGMVGAILLFMRKAGAATLFLASMIAVVIQFAYMFLGTDLLAVKGASSATFPAFIITVAILQWLYARFLVVRSMLR
ncbi:sugar transporter [Sphingobium sp.]|uniref:sugar transporter n=1 Tax=Sphingobium sp. TaxID=1912891 RepID=UPI003BB5B544